MHHTPNKTQLTKPKQDDYDDEDDEDDEWRDGEGDPCPGCGRLYRSVSWLALVLGCTGSGSSSSDSSDAHRCVAGQQQHQQLSKGGGTHALLVEGSKCICLEVTTCALSTLIMICVCLYTLFYAQDGRLLDCL